MQTDKIEREAAEIVAGMTDAELERAAKAGRSTYWRQYYSDPAVRERKRQYMKAYYARKAVAAGLKGGGDK